MARYPNGNPRPRPRPGGGTLVDGIQIAVAPLIVGATATVTVTAPTGWTIATITATGATLSGSGLTSPAVRTYAAPSGAVTITVTGTDAQGQAVSRSVTVTAQAAAPANTVAPSISGTATVGQTLTATEGTWTGTPTVTLQWLRGSTAISGATGLTYVLTEADLGATISVRATATNAGGSAVATSAGVGPVEAGGAVDPLTVPFEGSLITITGDSQVADAMATNVGTNRAYGAATSSWAWRLAKLLRNRVSFPVSYGISGRTSAQVAASSASDAAGAASLGCKVAIIVVGGNDGSYESGFEATLANYRTIFDNFTANGMRIVTYVVPKSDGGAGNQAHVLRRNWLSDPQRAIDWPNFTYVNVWDYLCRPSGYDIIEAYSDDNVHLNAAGSAVVAERLATVLGPLWPAAQFPEVTPDPITAAGCYGGVYAFAVGTGGTINNTGTAVVNGALPAGLSMNAGASFDGFTFDVGTETNSDGDAELSVRVRGRAGEVRPEGAMASQLLQIVLPELDNTGTAGFLDNRNIVQTARFKVDQGAKGLRRVLTYGRLAANGQSARFAYWGGFASTTSVNVGDIEYYDSLTVDGPVDTGDVPAPALITGANWRTIGSRSFQRSLYFNMAAAGEIDFTVRVSRCGLLVNPRNP